MEEFALTEWNERNDHDLKTKKINNNLLILCEQNTITDDLKFPSTGL